MTQQRNPFTRSGALRLNHPLFCGREKELARLEQACLSDLDFFLLVYGGRQNGKTTVLLRLEDVLSKRRDEGVRVCRVDFQSLPRATSREAYRHLVRSVTRVLPQAPAIPDDLDAPALSDFLEDALANETVQRLVLLLDELGTLPDTTREDLAHVLRALHTRRLGSHALAKVQFVLAGGMELYRLAVVEASALRNVCEIVRLGDLSEANAVALIVDGLTLVGMQQAQANVLGNAVYARVHGHPYFTQRLGELLAAQQIAGSSPDIARVEALSWALLEHDDALLEHLRHSLIEHKLEDAARHLLSASQRINRTNDATERLDLLGLAHRDGQYWAPRSALFSVALAEWLQLPVPPGLSLPEATQSIRSLAIQQYLHDLQLEQQAATQYGERATSPAEHVRFQRRLQELHSEVTRIEALQKIARPTWLPELIRIPAGPFLMGSRDDDSMADDDEKPQHRLELQEYWIGKTPVTNDQFRPFVEGDGYTNRAYWTQAGWAWREESDIISPNYWNDAQWNGADYPVVGVSWFEALAYCRWLSAQMGQRFRLPTEAEWEKAARGPDGMIWPWGNTWEAGRCNSEEAGIKRTTAVGHYPTGASPYGVLDMAGNVWEWCATVWHKSYPYRLENEWTEEYLEQNVIRCLRGGSWYSAQQYVRGAYRGDYDPRFRNYSRGLRLASHSLNKS